MAAARESRAPGGRVRRAAAHPTDRVQEAARRLQQLPAAPHDSGVVPAKNYSARPTASHLPFSAVGAIWPSGSKSKL